MIIGISGKMRAGKNTVANIIDSLCDKPSITWEHHSFAHKIKEVCSVILGVPVDKFDNSKYKDSQLPDVWSKGGNPITVREFMQLVGKSLRNGVHQNIWINTLLHKYIPGKSLWLITDVRFPSEAIAIKQKHGLLIRVDRPIEDRIAASDYVYSKSHPVLYDESETALDSWQYWDAVVENDYDVFDLRDIVQIGIVNKFKLNLL